jgi:branched-chain amino acid transport system substrate-binding protein
MKRKNVLITGVSICLICLLVGLSFISACGGPAPTSALKTLDIGGLVCLTGWFSTSDVQMWNEDLMMKDMINEGGGININGQKYEINLIGEDCQSSLDGTTSATSRLVYDEKVKFIIGPPCFFSMATSPIADPNEVLHVLTFCTATPQEIGPNVPYGFLGYDSAIGQVMAAVQVFKKHYPTYKKFALISPAGGYNEYIAAFTKKYLADNGMSIVGDWITFADDTVDYSPIAAKLNALKDADAIFMVCGIVPHIGNILKSLRALGNNEVYGCAVITASRDIMNISGKEAANNLFCIGAIGNSPGNPPEMDELINRLKSKYGADVYIDLESANALYTLVGVIQAAQSLDPSVVKAKWESMDKIETLFGSGIVCGDQTYGISHHVVAHPLPVQFLKNGEVSFDDWYDIGVIP